MRSLILCLFFVLDVEVYAHELMGTWRAPCPQAGYPSASALNFDRSTATWDFIIFSDESCMTRSRIQSYNISFVGDGDNPRNPDLTILDIVIRGVTIRPMSDESLREFRRSGYCGVSDWVLYEPRDVTGKDCEGILMPSAGTKIYGTYKISQGTLLLGKFSEAEDGSRPERRPASLDTTVSYRR